MKSIFRAQPAAWWLAGLLAGSVFVAPALADPPGRVARLSYNSGSVSFEPAGSQDWVDAQPNRPIYNGDTLWADAGARAEVNVGRVAVRLDSETSITLTNLDDQTAQVQLSQGTLELTVRRLDPNDIVEIDTPNLAFTATRPGTYRLSVAADGTSTVLAVERGQGNVVGQGNAYTISNAQAYSFTGNDLSNATYLDVPPPDDFDQFVASREQRFEQSQAARYVSHDMIGYEDLDGHGEWANADGYGNVWYPSGVAVGWAPYSTGSWAWVAPWGWTWVDAAPWGFAPFHYGRWALIGPRWGWIPGPVAVAPVYAPALVGFVGGAPGVSVGIGLGGGIGVGIGWFPLGPREVFTPGYEVSPGYVNRVNVSNTYVSATYVTNVYNNPAAQATYVNKTPGAMTAVSTGAFAGGQPVVRGGVAVSASFAAQAQVSHFAPVAPTAGALAAAPASSFHPPATSLARPVVAATPPPAAPVPFAAQQKQLQQSPGRPLTAAATQTIRATTPATGVAARPVTVVKPPAASAAPLARPAPAQAPARPGQLPAATRPPGSVQQAQPRPAAVPPRPVPAPAQVPGQAPHPAGAPAPPPAQAPAAHPEPHQGKPEEHREH